MIRYYQVFGLIVESPIPLPELQEVSPKMTAEVTIENGEIGAGISMPTATGILWKITPQAYELTVPDIARFLVTGGHRIRMEVASLADLTEVRSYLLGSVFGALLHQRSVLPLHASAFLVGYRAVLVGGRSGAGKSTVLQSFLQRGHTALSDDISPVSFLADGTPMVQGSYPHTRLCEDARQYFEGALPEVTGFRRVRNKTVFSIKEFDPSPRPISHLIVLRTHSIRKISVTSMQGPPALSEINHITYRSRYLRGMKKQKTHFLNLAHLVNHVPVTLIRHTPHLDTLPLLIDQISALIDAPPDRND